MESLEPDIESTGENERIWAQEAERRFQEIEEGKAVTKSASEVMGTARERFRA